MCILIANLTRTKFSPSEFQKTRGIRVAVRRCIFMPSRILSHLVDSWMLYFQIFKFFFLVYQTAYDIIYVGVYISLIFQKSQNKIFF